MHFKTRDRESNVFLVLFFYLLKRFIVSETSNLVIVVAMSRGQYVERFIKQLVKLNIKAKCYLFLVFGCTNLGLFWPVFSNINILSIFFLSI